MTFLPKPAKPYPTWAKFVQALHTHGLSIKNMDTAALNLALVEIPGLIFDAMSQRNEAKVIRPSAFLACARQTFYAHQGQPSGDMPDNIGTTFAIGHVLHQLSYAALQSAMPPGFVGFYELPVTLPDWWPKDAMKYNQKGTVDTLLKVTDSEVAADYLAADVIEAHPKQLVDFKSMGGFGFKKHGKALFDHDPDGFGYISQLTVYADSPGVDCLGSGAIMAGINRDSLTQPLKPRLVTADVLEAEKARLIAAFEAAANQEDPGEEFLMRHDDAANFFCGRGSGKGYCAFKEVCREQPSR